MIKKILEIKDFAVFKDFEWNKHVDSQGKAMCLQDINIFFGRNYSGKTTLSRIFRALELKGGLEKYESGSFKLEQSDGNTIDKNSITSFPDPVRVFNEDFVKDNLLFLNNPDDGITPFAVLGSSNVEIEQEIQVLNGQLGSSEEGHETGLYLELANATNAHQTASKAYKAAQEDLEEKVKQKALDRKNGIKYQASIYGDQNYTVAKLKEELRQVTQNNRLSEEKTIELKATLKEEEKQIPHIEKVPFQSFHDINQRIKTIVEQPIMQSDKIKELVHNAMANKWVEKGCELHKGKKSCLFCGGEITEHRWAKLERHYDEATKVLKEKAEKAFGWIGEQIQVVKDLYRISPENYYQSFKEETECINKDMDILRVEIISTLETIQQQVKAKLDNIHATPSYKEHTFDLARLDEIYARIERLKQNATEYGDKLKEEQSKTQKKLRLSEVARFKEEIDYEKKTKVILEKETALREKEATKKKKEDAVRSKEEEIKAKERLRQNEEEGARKINEILKHYFGHRFIELRAIKKENEEGIYFDVFRGEKKAYNLSEGERNLVAFAYFVAKLEDVDTASEKPIIWIDDPISSLDANHVFFIFSLIDQQIVANLRWSQLFISTHNLDFLRYLMQIYKSNKKKSLLLLIEREHSSSYIKKMPKYIETYTTEFVYLFHQIYLCAQQNEADGYEKFYNFGNNLRKFLEVYLYYRYPNNSSNKVSGKLLQFFSDENSASLINRIANEHSHNQGMLERSMTPSDCKEIKECAQYILDTIEKKDPDQYNCFMESIRDL